MEFPFDKTGLAATLSGGDILRVFSIVPAYQKTVTLRGDVANAGRFAWHDGMHLSELIPDRDSLLSRDYWWKRSHLGLPAPEFEPLISDFETNQRKPNRSNSYPCTTSNADPNSTNQPQINPNTGDPYPNIACPAPNGGNPNNPNSNNQQPYNNLDPTSPESQDALTAALNSSDRQDAAGYNIEPQNSRQSGSTGTVASQFGQMSGSGSTTQPKRTEVKISAPEIDWNYAVIERLDPQTLKTSLLPFDLGKLVLNHDTSQDFPLQPGDVITVFSQADIRVPLEEQTKYVSLEGEFVHGGGQSIVSE